MANESFTREDIKQAWESPRFNSLPEDDRIAIMSDMDPEFARFPAIDRRRVVQRFAQQLKAGRPNSMARPASEDMAAAVSLTNPQLDAPTFGGIAQPPMPPPPPAASRNPMRRSSDLASVPQDPYAATPAAGPSPFTVNSLPQDSTPAAAGTQQQQNPLEIEAARMGIIPHSDRTMLPAAKPTGVIRNIARPGPHVTLLPQNEELEFRKWVATNRVPFDPGPQSDYDMRGYWKALRARDQRVAGSDPLNPPAKFQTPYHPEFSNKSIFAGADAPKWMQDKLVDSFGRFIKDKAAEKAAEKMLAQKNVAAVAKRSPRQPFVFSPTGGINGMGDPEMVPQYQPPVETPLAGIIPGTEKMGGGAPGVPLPEMPEFNPSWQELQRQPGADNPKLFFDPMTGTSEPAAGSTPAEIAQFGMDEPTNVGIRSAFTGAGQMALDAPGGLAQMTGYAIGSPMLTGVGKDMADVGRGLSEALAPPPGMRSYDEAGNAVFADPNWWANTFGNGIGSMVPLMLAGMGIGAIIERAVGSGLIRGALAEHVIKYGPAATSGLSEGILAGGSAYNEAKAAGKSEAEAQQVFAIVAASTAATAIPAFKVGAFNDALPMVAKAPASALAEGGQEIVQGAGENYAADRPLMADSVENFVGGAFGGAGGAMMEGGANRPARVSPSMQQEFEGLDREMRGGQPNPPPPGAPPPAPPASNQQTPQAAPPAAPTPNPASTPPQQAEVAPQAPPPPPKKKNPMARPAAPAAPTIEEIPADIEEMLAAEDDGSEAPPDQYQTAVEMAKRKGKISPRDLQNELVIGFAEAEALAARLEKDGIVGPIESNGVRWLREETQDEISPATEEKPENAETPKNQQVAVENSPTNKNEGEISTPTNTSIPQKETSSAPGPGEEVVQPEPVEAAAPVVEERPSEKDSGEVAALKLKVSETESLMSATFPDDGPAVLGRGRSAKGTEGLVSRGYLERDHQTLTAEGSRIAKIVHALDKEDRNGRSMDSFKMGKIRIDDPSEGSRWDHTRSIEYDGDRWISTSHFALAGIPAPANWKTPKHSAGQVVPLDKVLDPIKNGLASASPIVPVAHFTPDSKDSDFRMVTMSDGSTVNAEYFEFINQNAKPTQWMSNGKGGAIAALKGKKLVAVLMPVGKLKIPDGVTRLLAEHKEKQTQPAPSTEPALPQPSPSTAPAPTQPAPSTTPAPEKPGKFDIAGAAGMTREELIRKAMENMGQPGTPPPAAAPAPTPNNPMAKKRESKAGQNTKKHPMSAMWAPKPDATPAPSKNPLDAAAEESKKRLRKMIRDAATGSQANAGIDPAALIELATIGAKHILDGAIAFKEWADRFTTDAAEFLEHFAKVTSQRVGTILRAIHDVAREMAKLHGTEAEETPSEEQFGDDEQSADDRGALAGSVPEGSQKTEGGGVTGASSGNRSGSRRPGSKSSSGEGAINPGSDGTGAAGVGDSAKPVGIDHRIPDGRVISGGAERRFEMNMAAIRLLRSLEKEGRKPGETTAEENETLAKYVGWGAVKSLFDGLTPEWRTRQQELKSLLTDEEYAAASHSTLNAHYTGDAQVDAVWDALLHLGAKPGMSYMEPSVGIGTFFGRQPESLLPDSRRVGFDKDTITGKLAQYLYPQAKIEVTPFEKSDAPMDYFDVAVSNVPFGPYGVSDPQWRNKPFLTQAIHNYFFARSLQSVKPGGVVAFITSRYTLDSYDKPANQFLDWIADRADFLGAVRLPTNAFMQSSGTHVITDVIFLRKRAEGDEPGSRDWTRTGNVTTDVKTKGREGSRKQHAQGNYFVSNPQNVLGEQISNRGQFSETDYEVKGSITKEQLSEALIKALPKDILKKTAQKEDTRIRAKDVAGATDEKIGAFFTDPKGKLFRRTSRGQVEPVVTSSGNQKRIVGQIAIRDALKELLAAELIDSDTAQLDKLRKKLNVAYDAFYEQYGALSWRYNIKAFDGDPDLPLLLSLEKDVKKKEAKKQGIFTKRVLEPTRPIEKADSSAEALTVSLNETGRVDWKRMSELTGKTEEDLQKELAGLVFQDPQSRSWQIAEEYLSGSVRTKLKQAQQIAKLEPKFQANVDALKAAIPDDIEPFDISARLGSPWVEPDTYENFIREALGLRSDAKVKVHHNPATGSWFIDAPWALATDKSLTTDGTSLSEVFEKAFDSKRIRVTHKDSNGNTYTDIKQTAAANAKIDDAHEKFRKWLLIDDAARSKEMASLYNEKMNDIRLRTFDGSHLTLPGKASSINLHSHQKAAIWRLITQKNTLLAHTVGAGKTFEMIAGAMELRRIGLVKRPMFVVPNATLPGWQEQFGALYPNARVLVLADTDLAKEKRRATIARMATSTWDAVVLPHSSFGLIKVNDEMFDEAFEEQKELLNQQIRDAEEAGIDPRRIRQIETSNANMLKRMEDNRNAEKQDDVVTWDQLGIDMLLVDEAHEFKKLGFSTKMGQIAGIDSGNNQKTFDLKMKVRHVQKTGRGVVFATGTPVTNTMGEMYNMMRYLIEDDLKARGMTSFDDWSANFGRTVPVWEPKAEGGGYQLKSRFARFVNMPELATLFRTFADVVTSDMLDIPRPEPVQHVVTTDLNPAQIELMEELQGRAQAIRADPRKAMPDNMLSIYGDAQKLSLDARFLDSSAGEYVDSRLNKVADNVFAIWEETKEKRSTQVIFSDLGVPGAKSGQVFPMYLRLIDKLVERGIPREEIEHIYNAKNKEQRTNIFDAMNEGKIRVLLGSTMKLGVGVNVQRKLAAMHHMDLPHRPSDVEQRNGRGHRQGNENKEIHIWTYLTKGTLDELKASTLARKAAFISQVLQGKLTVRTIEDIGGMVATFESFQSAASNDPRVPLMKSLEGEVNRLDMVRSEWRSQQYREKRESQAIEERIPKVKKDLEHLKDAIGIRDLNGRKWEIGDTKLEGEGIADAVGRAARAKIIENAEKINGDQNISLPLGSAYGFPIEQSVSAFANGNFIFRIRGLASVTVDDINNVGVGFVASIENQIKLLEKRSKNLENDLEDMAKRLKSIEKNQEDSWPHEDELKAKLANLEAIRKELGTDKGDEDIGVDSIQSDDVDSEEEDPDSDNTVAEMLSGSEDTQTADEPGEVQRIRRPVTRGSDQAGFMAPDFLPTILGGLAGRLRRNPMQKATDDYHKFPEENEKPFQAAGKAQEEPKGIMDTLKEAYGDFKSLGRVYRHLSRSDFGPVINKMVKLQKAQGIASSRAMISMSKLVHQTGKMTKPEYELLRKSVIVDDLMETVELFAEKGKPLADDHKLAFNFTPATLRVEQERLKTAIADNEAVSAALEYRKSIWAEIKDEYLEAMKAAGEDVTGKMQRKNYYKHEVLLQKRLEALAGAGKMAVPNQRGFLKARDEKNIGLDYQTNFVETEMKVMTQLMIDTQTAQFVAWLDGKHNIIRDLKEKAKWKNVATVMPYFEAMAAEANAQRGPQDDSEPLTGNDMFRRTLNRQQAIAMDELGKLAVNDLLPDTPDKKWEETIAALADRHLAKKAAEDEESFHGDTEAGDVIGYAAWLLRQPEASKASRAAGSLFKGIQAKKTAIKRIAGDKFVTWEDLVPDTHRSYQMDPKKAYYSVFTIPEHLALKALEDQAETIGLKAEDIRKVFARGADKDPMILPAEIVKQFEEMQATMAARKVQENILGKGSRAIMGAWKRYQLLSPLRAAKYFLRNQTGDMDSMISGLPWGLTLKMIPKVLWPAMKEVKNYFYPILMGRIHEAKMTPKLEGFAKFGAFEGMLAVQEIGDPVVPNVLQEFSRWEKQEPEPGLLKQYGPQSIYGKSMRVAEVINNWREAANRYAAYLVFLEDIRKNGGKPSSYSASLKEEVDALETNEEKAYRMSNDLMGAYDEVSRAGQWTRKNLIPFWSYQELNFKRYARLVRNGVREGMTKELVGRMAVGAAARAPYMAYRVASTGVKMYALWALWTMLNGLFAGDDDDKLRKDIRLRPHLTFGSTPDGTEVIYFPRIGNISDILEILDLDEMQDSVKAAWEGRKGWDRAAWDILRGGPLEKLFNSLGPHIKYPIEAIFDKTFYPNIGRPRAIESWPEKIAQELGLGDAFRGLTGRPNRQLNPMQRAADLVIYRADPKESGYYDTLDMKQSWRREQGLPDDGFSSNKPTTEAIRNVKKALRYRDQAAFNTYLQKYVELGGDEKGFDASIKRMAPLAGLNKEQQARFIESLSAEDKKRLDLALEYYDEVFTGDTADKYFREYAPK
jgi:N12 class adenine-specific DNA methylase